MGTFVLAWTFAPPAHAGLGTFVVRAFSGVAPGTVTDLSVSSTTIEGQVQLQWTAPTVFNGTTLDSYQIRAATFSLVDVGNSTTTWWNSASSVFAQGFYGESPGQPVIRTLGPPGSSHTVSLFPGATYYFAVRSADDVGLTFDAWAPIAATPQAVPLDTPPATPTGLAVAVSQSSFTLSWTDLTSTAKGLDFDSYRLYRSSAGPSGPYQLFASTTGTSIQDATVLLGVAYTYYLTAVDKGAPLYPGATLESGSSTVVPAQLAGTPAVPQKPNGLYIQNTGGDFELSWHAVTYDTTGQPLAVDHYRIDRYETIGSSPSASYTVPGSVTSFTAALGGDSVYYRVIAVTIAGITSVPSDYADTSNNRIAVADDDPQTRVVIPQSLLNELRLEGNDAGEDIEIRFTHRPNDETDPTLRSYFIGAYKVPSGEEIPRFAFSQPAISVQLGYDAILANGHAKGSQSVALRSAHQIGTEALARIISIYWFNGAGFIPLGNPVLSLQDDSIDVTVSNLGVYQIRARSLGSTFQLSKGSPYPRLITPHDPAQNNRVFFFFDNPTDEEVSGTIYDLRGAKVRDIAPGGLAPTPNSMVWDGKDSNGSIVPTGIYLYKVRAGKESATGTLVVAE